MGERKQNAPGRFHNFGRASDGPFPQPPFPKKYNFTLNKYYSPTRFLCVCSAPLSQIVCPWSLGGVSWGPGPQGP